MTDESGTLGGGETPTEETKPAFDFSLERQKRQSRNRSWIARQSAGREGSESMPKKTEDGSLARRTTMTGHTECPKQNLTLLRRVPRQRGSAPARVLAQDCGRVMSFRSLDSNHETIKEGGDRASLQESFGAAITSPISVVARDGAALSDIFGSLSVDPVRSVGLSYGTDSSLQGDKDDTGIFPEAIAPVSGSDAMPPLTAGVIANPTNTHVKCEKGGNRAGLESTSHLVKYMPSQTPSGTHNTPFALTLALLDQEPAWTQQHAQMRGSVVRYTQRSAGRDRKGRGGARDHFVDEMGAHEAVTCVEGCCIGAALHGGHSQKQACMQRTEALLSASPRQQQQQQQQQQENRQRQEQEEGVDEEDQEEVYQEQAQENQEQQAADVSQLVSAPPPKHTEELGSSSKSQPSQSLRPASAGLEIRMVAQAKEDSSALGTGPVGCSPYPPQ